MAEQGFLSRWSRLKAEAREAPDPAPAGAARPARGMAHTPPVPESPQPAPAGHPGTGDGPDPARAPALPTLEDAMRLGPDSDYSAFVARGVDPSVRRQALRTLFADPHFNVLDGLDIYMGDYTKPDPMPPAMLASLEQAHSWLRKQVREDDDAAPAQPDGATATHHNEAAAPGSAPAREQDEH